MSKKKKVSADPNEEVVETKKAKKEKKRLEHDRINEVSEENSSQAH